MSQTYTYLLNVFYMLVILFMMIHSVRILYRRPRFGFLVYSSSYLLFLILLIMLGISTLYSLLTGIYIPVVVLDILSGMIAAAIILPGGWSSARRRGIPRLIWLRKTYWRYPGIGPREFLTASVGAGIFAIVYTIVLFYFVEAEIHPDFLENLKEIGLDRPGTTLIEAVLILAAPFTEEIIFRFVLISVILDLLKRRNFFTVLLALLFSSIVWTAFHTGMVLPFGIKEAQIFGIGIILGLLLLRYGLEAAIIAHFILNFNVLLGILIVHPMTSG